MKTNTILAGAFLALSTVQALPRSDLVELSQQPNVNPSADHAITEHLANLKGVIGHKEHHTTGEKHAHHKSVEDNAKLEKKHGKSRSRKYRRPHRVHRLHKGPKAAKNGTKVHHDDSVKGEAETKSPIEHKDQVALPLSESGLFSNTKPTKQHQISPASKGSVKSVKREAAAEAEAEAYAEAEAKHKVPGFVQEMAQTAVGSVASAGATALFDKMTKPKLKREAVAEAEARRHHEFAQGMAMSAVSGVAEAGVTAAINHMSQPKLKREADAEAEPIGLAMRDYHFVKGVPYHTVGGPAAFNKILGPRNAEPGPPQNKVHKAAPHTPAKQNPAHHQPAPHQPAPQKPVPHQSAPQKPATQQPAPQKPVTQQSAPQKPSTAQQPAPPKGSTEDKPKTGASNAPGSSLFRSTVDAVVPAGLAAVAGAVMDQKTRERLNPPEPVPSPSPSPSPSPIPRA